MPFIQLQFRRGTAARWQNANPILAAGEMGLEGDTDRFKIGDGVTSWNSLPYGGLKGDKGDPGDTVAYSFNGGYPSTDYTVGPAFDCGSVK